MHVLIDGHNLIGKLPDISLSDRDDEMKLLRRIQQYRARTGQRVTVFFDGGAVYKPGSKQTVGGITIRYAPHGVTADTLIINRLRQERNPKEVLVVSSDRAIQRAAQLARANVMSSTEFSGVLTELRTPAATATDDAPLPPEEVNEWLSIFGGEPDE